MHVSTPRLAVGVRALGHRLPSRRLTNADLIAFGCPSSDQWITAKTGIRARHVADDGEALSDLAIGAARSALGAIESSNVDTVIVGGDYLDFGGVRLTSGVVATALGIEGAATYDLKMGCPASVAGLHLAAGLVASGISTRTLLSVAEINTRGVNWADRGAVWFGDAGAAAVIEECANSDDGILATVMAGTGVGAEILQVPAGGSVEPTSEATVAKNRHALHHDARAVYSFAVDAMVTTARELVAHVGVHVRDLDLVVPHQANLRVIETAAAALGLPMDKVALSLVDRGNTGAPSVLMTLSEAAAQGRLKPGALVMTVGFGGGLAWGGQLMRWADPSEFVSQQN